MLTFGAFRRQAFRSGLTEAQDVLAECDDVDLLRLEPAPGFALKEEMYRRLMARDISRTLAYVNPGLRNVRLDRNYELFVVVCPTWLDTQYVNAVDGWQDRCNTSVCWIDEIWANSVPNYRYWLPSLARFDHVVVGLSGSVRAVSEAIGKPVHCIPGGVNAIRFSPYPRPPNRVVDVYSVGRRCDGMHNELLKLAGAQDIFYIYDTIQHGNSMTPDFVQHRNLYANIAKRSTFFTVAPAKMNLDSHTGGQSEVAFRYFDGAAAGAVMIGQSPSSQSFRDMFDWPDAVIQVDPDGSDIGEALATLSTQPERVLAISRRNAAEALLRHDWIYRWKQILAIAGLEPTAGMRRREQLLGDLAALARRGT